MPSPKSLHLGPTWATAGPVVPTRVSSVGCAGFAAPRPRVNVSCVALSSHLGGTPGWPSLIYSVEKLP